MRYLLALSLMIPIGCGDDSGSDEPPPPVDAGGGEDAGPSCIAENDMCEMGGTECCGLLVCRAASVGAYCVHIEDTCFVGARDGCCLDDADCAEDDRCHDVLECRQMGEGRCKGLPPPDGSCWSDRDCTAGGNCVGASICPCGTTCAVEDTPGMCDNV